MNGRIKTLLFALALVAASFAVYHATLWNSFVYDDAEQVLRNRWITDSGYLKEIFTSHTFAFAESSYQAISYRPLFLAFYMAEYAIFGLEPWGWHFVNIILHSANAIIAFLLIRRLMGEEERASFAAFAGALVFTVLPAGSEVVSWVGCVPELIYTFLCLVSFYVYAGAGKGVGRVVVSAFFYFIAAFTKETAIIFPVFLYVYDSLREGWVPVLSRVKRYIPFAAAAFAYIGIKSALLGHIAAPVRIHTDLKPADFLASAPYLFVEYLRALVFPEGVYPLQPFAPIPFFGAEFILSALVIVALSVFCFYFRKRFGRLALLALAILVVPLLPALYAPAISRTPFAERYLYLPSVGLALLIALVFQRGLLYSAVWRKALIIALAVVSAFYSVWSYKKSLNWGDDRALWEASLKGGPGNYLALHSLGYIALKEGRDIEAMELLSKALKFNLEGSHPDPTMVLLTRKILANAYQRGGLSDLAALEYEEVLRYEPEDPVAGFNLGTIYEGMGRPGDAIDLYEKALYFAKRPELLREIILRLGEGYAKAGRATEARALYERGAEAFPGDPEFQQRARVLPAR